MESPPDDAVQQTGDLGTCTLPVNKKKRTYSKLVKRMKNNNRSSSDDCPKEKPEQVENYDTSNESSSDNCSSEQILETCLSKQDPEKSPQQASGSKFVCRVCRKTFLDSDTFEIHKNEHSKEGCYPCASCKISFRWKEFLDTHLLIHVGGRPYICQICGEEFLWKRDFKSHFENHVTYSTKNETLLFPCTGCWKMFSSKRERKIHKRMCARGIGKRQGHVEYSNSPNLSQDTKFAWPDMQQVVQTSIPGRKRPLAIKPEPVEGETTSATSNKRMFILINGRLIPLQVGSAATSSDPLSSKEGMLCLSSIPVVYDDKDRTCAKCGKLFEDIERFIEHTRLHNLDGPFACTDCSSSYLWKEFLSTHQRMHVYRRPYNCDVCGDYFHWKGELRLHFEEHVKYLSENMGPCPYICVDCKQRFASSESLRFHRAVCLKNNNSSVICYEPPPTKIRKDVRTICEDMRAGHYCQVTADDGLEEDSVEIKMEKDPLEASDFVNFPFGVDVESPENYQIRDSDSQDPLGDLPVVYCSEVKQECIEIEEEEDPLKISHNENFGV